MGESKQKQEFPLETRKEVSFQSTSIALNFTNLPLSLTMQNFHLLLTGR